MLRRVLFLLVLVALLGTPLAAGTLVNNGGFETGDFTGWTTAPAACGSYFYVGTGSANSGSDSVWFGGFCSGSYDTISQDITTVPGTAYIFSFWLASNDSSDNGQMALWNGTDLLGGLTNFTQDYVQYSFTLPATAPTTTIAFAGYNRVGFNLLDDVSVTAAVPEPATMALLGVALAGSILIRRRRK